MDDTRIRQLTEEVLAQLRDAPREERPDLEARVAALEAAVRKLLGAQSGTTTTVQVTTEPAAPHPSLRSLALPAPAERCVLEPDKPCVRSGQCRSLGH